MAKQALIQTDLPLAGKRQGKVRDVYEAGNFLGKPALLLVATDRLSAFDVVMPNGIPGKGVILTQLSNFWFNMIREKFGAALPIHVLGTDPAILRGLSPEQVESIQGRSVIGRKTRVIPVECVVRGYLAGSGWAEYKRNSTVCGEKLPRGLKLGSELPEPIFTPATKAETGHDENISVNEMVRVVGAELTGKLMDLSIRVYKMARDYARDRGIIIADTKFEFGLEIDPATNEPCSADPILIDEVLTPDSSRFWPVEGYTPGENPPSFDKQFVRDYLEELFLANQWDKMPPGPVIPDPVIEKTLEKYLDAYRMLTGKSLTL